MRNITKTRDTSEDIVSYRHTVGQEVVVDIATGETREGAFYPNPRRMLESIAIEGTNYSELMQPDPRKGKDQDAFGKQDLWKYIDRIRDGD